MSFEAKCVQYIFTLFVIDTVAACNCVVKSRSKLFRSESVRFYCFRIISSNGVTICGFSFQTTVLCVILGGICPNVKAAQLTNIKASELQIWRRLFNRLCKFIQTRCCRQLYATARRERNMKYASHRLLLRLRRARPVTAFKMQYTVITSRNYCFKCAKYVSNNSDISL